MNSLLKKHLEGPGGISQMLAIALPMVASNACDTVMIFTDRLFLSKIGTEQMSAAMGGGLTSFMMSTFFLGLIGYSTALVAQYFGANRKNQCSVAVAQAMIIACIAYPVILVFRPAGLWLFEITHVPIQQLALQKQYFNILLYGAIIGLLRNCLSCFFSGIGKTRIVMVSAFTAMIANVGLNYIFIYGKLGFPAMGIRGAAYGTIIGGICGLLILAAAYWGRKNAAEYDSRKHWSLNWKVMKKLLRFGYPSGMEFFLNLLAFDILVLLFHSCGQSTAAAITIVFNWDMVSFIPLLGVHIGVTSLVGRYMGSQQPDVAHRSTMSGLKLAWIYSFCTLLIFALFPTYLVGAFRPVNDDVVFTQAFPAAVFMLRLAAFYVMADAVMLVFSGALRGAGDTFWAMCISVTMHWTLVAVLYVLIKIFHAAPQTGWVVLCTILMLFSGVLYLRYRSGKWRSIRVIEDELEFIPPTDGLHETIDL